MRKRTRPDAGRGRHHFCEPARSACTKYRWNAKNTISGITIDKKAPADSTSKLAPNAVVHVPAVDGGTLKPRECRHLPPARVRGARGVRVRVRAGCARSCARGATRVCYAEPCARCHRALACCTARAARAKTSGSDRHRSGDLSIFSRTLYQLSYRALSGTAAHRRHPHGYECPSIEGALNPRP